MAVARMRHTSPETRAVFEAATLSWLQDALPVGVFVTDRALCVKAWNHWLEVHSGLGAGAVLGRSLLDMYPDLVTRRLDRVFQAALGGQSRRLSRRVHPYLLPMRIGSGRPMQQTCTISPLWHEGDIVGTVGVLADVTRDVQQSAVLRHQVEELERVRGQLARKSAALERTLSHEQQVVQAFATSFLQERPYDPVLDIGCLYEPARSADHVGGDFYDFIRLDDDRLAIVVGDVCGKGIQAGVYTAMAKYTLRAYAAEDPTPDRLVRRVNEALCRQMNDPSMFISLVYAVVDVNRQVAQWVNAGHPAPLLLDGDARACYLEPTTLVLGAVADMTVEQAERPFGPGSRLALVTDGVTDAGGDALTTDECGLAAVCAGEGDAATLVQRIYRRALEQSRGHLKDDVAIVVARYPHALGGPHRISWR